MARKMSVVIIATIALLSIAVHAQQNSIETQVGLLHASKSVAGNLLPQISEDPSSGIGISAKYPIGLAAFGGGFSTATTRLWNTGHQSTCIQCISVVR